MKFTRLGSSGLAISRICLGMQNHYNLLYREEERDMIPFCRAQGVGILPYSPLARGVLAGPRRGAGDPPTARSANDPLADSRYDHWDSAVVDVVVSIARERGLAPAQIALAWLLRQPGISAPAPPGSRPLLNHRVLSAAASASSGGAGDSG